MFDDEPIIIIFNRDNYIVDRIIDLDPFDRIVEIIDNENNFRARMENLNKTFVIVCIFPQWNYSQVQAFVQQNIITSPRIRLFCLFFINGQLVNMNTLGDNRIIGCHPITSQTTANTRRVCARANHLNIRYCENQRLLNDQQGDIGIADIYARQKDARLSLELEYNKQLLREIEQRARAQQSN